MLLAGSLRLETVLAELAKARPVFHSERDMQHAFAWQVQVMDPQMLVRLETHPEPQVRLDVLLSRPNLGQHTAVELKYPTRAWAGEVEGERFALKAHGADDVISYDVVKDVGRVERFASRSMGWNGLVLVVTNDGTYWRPRTNHRKTNADAFRIFEGRRLAGLCDWGPRTGGGSKKNRETAIVLQGSYDLHWADFSRLPGDGGVFRALAIPVEGSVTPAAPHLQ
jgi:hypothetical protein